MKANPISVLILEDEDPAANLLISRLQGLTQSVTVLHVAESVEAACHWWSLANDKPNLILSDINLTDGLSFEFFKSMGVEAPVIFTTAYDQFMLDAFKLNAIDYLLKPVSQIALQQSMDKFIRVQPPHLPPSTADALLQSATSKTRAYRLRYMVEYRDAYLLLETDDILYLHVEGRLLQAYTRQGKTLTLDGTLDQAEAELDTSVFFRLNRQLLARREAINNLHKHFNGKLALELINWPEPALVSRERSPQLRQWLEGL